MRCLPSLGRLTWRPGGWATLRALILAIAWLLVGHGTVLAQEFTYRFVIDAPPALVPLIERHLDIARWRDNPRMSPNLLQVAHRDAPRQLAEVLESEGYYAPTITAELDSAATPPLARYRVEAGPRARVEAVSIEFTEPLADAPESESPTRKALREAWPMPVGKVFRQADWETAKRTLLQHVLAERYPAARVAVSTAEVDPVRHVARLQIVIDSGPAYVFGATEVQGLVRYPRQIVERLSPLSAGDTYASAKLLQFQTRLQDTGYFSYVEVVAVPASDATTPVTVIVREAQSVTVGLGAGFSTNTGARGQLHYEDRNLLERGWRLDGRLMLEQKQQLLSADVRLPINADGSRDSLGASWQRTDIQNETTATLGLRARRAWGSDRTEHFLITEALIETKEVPGLAADQSGALYFGYGLTLRRTDSTTYPRAGYHAQMQLGGAPLGVVAERPFLRAWGKLQHYTPVAARGVLILRAELGAVFSGSRSGIPQNYLFRAGGDQSVRGHAYQSLGVSEGEAIVGGRYLATASAEYMHWLTDAWGAAVFIDAGTATDNRRDSLLAHGAGLGLRWKSAAGPLNLDLAQGSLDGSDSKQWRLHFSVGFTF